MNSQIDKRYLSLQFRTRIYEKNGSEFQSFFSDIMQKSDSEFRKIKPYGPLGDGGNDGYIPSKGIYYQVYSPENPFDKDAEAAKKMVTDFNKLKDSWEPISSIKEYHFVFNDRNNGLTSPLESARAQLRDENPNIIFSILLPIELEETFLSLKTDQLVALGFDVDQRNILKISREYLEVLKTELNRGYAADVLRTLNTIRSIFLSLEDEQLLLDFEILEATALQRNEDVDAAMRKYESLYKRYPNDIRVPLGLANIYGTVGNLEKNQELLDKAKAIDSSDGLYRLHTILRKIYAQETINYQCIDTTSFPEDAKLKADFYRTYALLLIRSEDYENASVFIERALHFNPEKILNYDPRIIIAANEICREPDEERRKVKTHELIKEIDTIENKFSSSGDIGNRNRLVFAYRKSTLFFQASLFELATNTENKIPELIFSCYFDNFIDSILTKILYSSNLSDTQIEELIHYLNQASKQPSEALAKQLYVHFQYKRILHTFGKDFFVNKNLLEFVKLIEYMEAKDYDSFVSEIKSDYSFSKLVFNTSDNHKLRVKLLEVLPDNREIDKKKLEALMQYETKNNDIAFKLLDEIPISSIHYLECGVFIQIAISNKAWEWVIALGEKMLYYETETKYIVKVKVQLFKANMGLDRLQQAVAIGQEILNNEKYLSFFNTEEIEDLLVLTLKALLKRHTEEDNIRAKSLLERQKHRLSTFEGNVWLASEIYLRDKDPHMALSSIIRGVRILQRPSPQDYANLYPIFNEIAHLKKLEEESEETVTGDRFVKFEEEDTWHFVGEHESLDAHQVPIEKHSMYLGKRVGEGVLFQSKYTSIKNEKKIEFILPIEKYIAKQVFNYFKKLSSDGLLEDLISIEVPLKEDGRFDFTNLIAAMKDMQGPNQELFDLYCETEIPLSLLAKSAGDLTFAIGKVVNEEQGFIHVSSGNNEEFGSQMDTARRILKNNEIFYLDGTSAWILTETGLFPKVYKYASNLKVPQTVISLLISLKVKLTNGIGRRGRMALMKDKIQYSELSEEHQQLFIGRYSNAITLLESNNSQISFISAASKKDVLSEGRGLPELCDATILAQRERVPILTEDYLHLHFNELETNKAQPEYFSSVALIRVLQEEGYISFQEFLDFFSCLVEYRFKFLWLTTDDLLNAILDDHLTARAWMDNLKKFHLETVLSKEYGADSLRSFNLIVHFLLKLLDNSSVSPRAIGEIYTAIISIFPTEMTKKQLGILFTAVLINNSSGNFQEKLSVLLEVNEKL